MINFEIKIKEIIDKQNYEINKLKKDLKNLRDENNNLKEENKKLNDKIEEIMKKTNKKINSIILENEEYDMIKSAIETRMKKKIKEIKKIYQAKIDGSDPKIFHQKCDNIVNTLIFIQSAGNKRFGGFTSEKWNSIENWKNDKNAFIFSLDKKMIYPYKNDGRAIYCKDDYGPCFGFGFDIGIDGDPLKEESLKTFKTDSFNYYGNDAVSEDKDYNGIYANDYEVFQVIF